MEEDVKPVDRVAVGADSGKVKIDFPAGKMIQVHTCAESEGGKVSKTVTRTNGKTGEQYEKEVNQAIYHFTIDSDVKDRKTGESLKGKTFTKYIALSDNPEGSYAPFITAATGGYTGNYWEGYNKPLQVLFQEWTTKNFGGGDVEYQPVTYLPPAEGQAVPEADVVLEDLPEEGKVNLDEVFGPGVKEVK